MSEQQGVRDIQIKGQTLSMDHRKALYWQETQTLIVSDLHLGKAGHFRKSGIPIPTAVHISDIERLETLVQDYQPKRVLFLGDLFHSDHNEEWNQFDAWLQGKTSIKMILVRGNHDIMDEDIYQLSSLEIVDELIEKGFHFSHDAVETERYNISGHVHPGIRLVGKARQTTVLPCFYFQEGAGLLPAFGNFTGTFKIKPVKEAKVYAIAEGVVFAINH